MTLRIVPWVLLALVSLGCATMFQPTKYQPDGLTGGYSEAQVRETVYDVYFRGNAYITPEKVEDYVMYRAAEIAIERGFKYFRVLSVDESEAIEGYTTVYSKTAKTTFLRKPRAHVRIQLLSENPDTKDPYIYNARELERSIAHFVRRG